MKYKDKCLDKLRKSSKYITALLKWCALSVIIGVVCGLSGVLFHYSVEYASEIRVHYPMLILLLPFSGLLIVFLYRLCKMQNDKGTNTVINSIRSSEKIPILMAPLILIGTTLTHLCGGSSGREGAALQIGGSIGSWMASRFHFGEKDVHVMTMCGMSALFSAVFGTPLTAAVFSMEVISVGIIYYNAFFPCLTSAIIAYFIANFAHVPAARFDLSFLPEASLLVFGKIIVLAALCALISVIFVFSMHKFSRAYTKYVKSDYLRAVFGAIIVIAFTIVLKTYDYNGVGMEIIRRAVEEGSARPEAFLLKMILTVVTLSSGFKGGEIVPTFFIGSTFGVCMSHLLGLDSSFCAAIGLIALFCGVVNCPIASIILSIELFGSEGLLFFALASSVSYIMSGYYGLYSSQKIVYSKLESTFINKDAK